MNLLLPLAAVGIGAGLYVVREQKKRAAGGLAAMKASSDYKTAAWSTSLSVADVQHALNELGQSPPLAVDGIAGPKTEDAIREFQHHAGVAVDGVVGPETTAALEHALSGAHPQVAGSFFFNDRLFDGDEGDEGYDDEDDDVDYVGAGWGGGDDQGWDAPSVQEIMADPQQQMMIGLNELWRRKAEAAYGGAPAAGYDYSFLPDQGQGAQSLASQELEEISGGELGGVNLVSGPGDDWSAPDVEESYSDPEQVAEMQMMAARAYGWPQQIQAPPMETYYGEQYGFQEPVPPPGVYPYGPLSGAAWAPHYPAPNAAMAGYPYGPYGSFPNVNQGQLEAVNAQGYEFASQQGRSF